MCRTIALTTPREAVFGNRHLLQGVLPPPPLAPEDDDPSPWTLESCCSGQQIAFICFFGGFLVIDLILWPFWVSKPVKMLAVFVHEMCHATATWMTCGTVVKLEVHTNEGGVCNYKGGWQPLIIPAGYLGGAFWGSAMIVATANEISCYVLTGILLAGLIVALWYSGNWSLRWMCLGFMIIIVVFLVVDILTSFKALKFVILYFGVFVAAFSIYDIWDDTIKRVVDEKDVKSDAVACHEMIPCIPSRLWGILWIFVALGFMGASLYLALVILGM